MANDKPTVDDRQLILDAKARGTAATLGTYVKLSGPGWLQSAITLGGGSLASSLYLGVLGGLALLWLQPLAMILGIVMLSAISYVALSIEDRPFRVINAHINPVLGWGWAIATLMANLVWSLPQFSLGTAAVRQNLLPGIFGDEAMPETQAKLIVGGAIMVICICIAWFYNSGNIGVKIFNIVLKLMVGLIVICFFGVVIRMSWSGLVQWDDVFSGFVPDLRLLIAPARTFQPLLADVSPVFREFWSTLIVAQQRDVMISAAATAVGINMTFLLPYSMLRRGWDREFRGLAIFDLSTGLFVPFLLATSCVVIASATQFHTRPAPGLLAAESAAGQPAPPKNIVDAYKKLATQRAAHEFGAEKFEQLSEAERTRMVDALPAADKRMAAMLVKRDAFNLADSLAPLTGDVFAHYVFGIGVVGMAISSVIILMLINGFVVCEMFGKEWTGWPYRLGTLMPCIGIIAPFIWTGGKAQFWLAIPTSVFGMVLLPVAYFTFYMLMNRKSVLGDDRPRGTRRLVWNVLMTIAASFALLGSIWSLWSKLRWAGIGVAVGFLGLAMIVQVIRSKDVQS
jgi:Mn2+/Fe2+ NRAMP family transporter